MFCWHSKRILLHKYQQNIFVALAQAFAIFTPYSFYMINTFAHGKYFS